MYRDQDMNTHAFSIVHGRPIKFTMKSLFCGILVTYGFQNMRISKNEIVPCGDICHAWLVRSPAGGICFKNGVFQKMK